jgi:phosphate transport system substrate-binding protein
VNRRMPLACAAAVAVALVAGACGSDNNTTASPTTTPGSVAPGATTIFAGANDKATLSGAGSTFVATIAQEWIKQYKTAAPGVTVNYTGVGSGAGIQQLTSKTVDFAGSDAPLSADQATATGGAGAVMQIPWIAGGVAVEYKLSSVKTLKLAPATLAGIFAGKITKWDDAAIKADNTGVSLPNSGIQVVYRSDSSGTTQVFTDYLRAAAPEVWSPVGPSSSKDWPAGTPGTGSKGSDGVTAAVKQSEGAIGYSEVSYPKQAGLGTALVKNKAGQFVGPTSAAVSAALAGATVNPDLTLKLNYLPDDPAAYAISTTTYLMFYKSSGDAAKDSAVKHFANWVLADGQKLAEGLDYAPMPAPILAQARTVVGA